MHRFHVGRLTARYAVHDNPTAKPSPNPATRSPLDPTPSMPKFVPQPPRSPTPVNAEAHPS